MNKEKIIKFINLILSTDNLDQISIENYKQVKHILENIDSLEFENFSHTIKRSSDIIKIMSENFDLYNDSFLKFKKTNIVDYNQIRKELHFYPSYNEKKGIEIKKKIEKIYEKHHYILKIDSIELNLFFYGNLDYNIITNMSRIIFLFFKTFGKNSKIYDKYNIRFLLIDFPRLLDSKKSKNTYSFKDLGEKGYYNNSSGVNIFSKKELVVTRKSGLQGLLIHELIHMLGLDFCYSLKDNEHINILGWEKSWIERNNIKTNDNNILSFIEGICNTNSSYFLAIYNSIYLSKKINDGKEMKYFKYFLFVEFVYAYINTAKLISYFNFNDYDSFFNNNSDRRFYQNALVFEYVIIRMFIISDYYRLLLKNMIKNNFNDTNKKINKNFQLELNEKLLKIVDNGTMKNIFNKIMTLVNNFDSNYIEYFCTNFN